MTIHTVSSSDELTAALNSASSGDVVELAAGDYGNFSMRRLDFSSEIIVRSADPDDPAVFNTLTVTSSSNITFDSLFIDFTPTENTVEWSTAFRAVQGVSNITLRNSKIEGGNSIAGVSPDSDPGAQGASGILGEPIGRAITFAGTGIMIENNDISHFKNGIAMGGSGNSIIGNNIYDLRTSPIRGNGNDLLIDGNYFHDSTPWKIGGAGDHGDYIHLWTNPDGEPMSNITITNNVFSDENGGSLLGIYLDDNGNGVGYENVLVDNNVIYSTTGQAVRFENVANATISHNTILNKDGVEKSGSQLVMVDGTRDIHLENNIVSTFISEESQVALAEKGFTFTNNLDVSYNDPNADNYIGRLFSDSWNEDSGLWSKIVVPGSPADGLGSELMRLDGYPERLMPAFEVESGNNSDQELVFRADMTSAPDGPISATNAQFIWDFGDGSTAVGQVVRHSYADAGRYDATLTVVMPNGTAARATSQIGIMGADLISFNSETGLFRAEGYGVTTEIEGSNNALIATGGAHGVNLGGSGVQASVGKEHIDRHFGSNTFDLSMTLRADTLGSMGENARVHGNFVLSVAARGELKLELTTDSEGTSLFTTGVTVNDGVDHDIRISFDGVSNNLTIHVDDQLVGASEIEGGMRTDYPRALIFGNPWGKVNFDGTLTAFDLEVRNQDYPAYEGDASALSDSVLPEDTAQEAPDLIIPETTDGDATVVAPAPEERGNTPEKGDTQTAPPPSQVPAEQPTDYEPNFPKLPLYKADFAEADVIESGIKMIGDAHIVQDDDGTARVVLDGQKDHVALGRVEALEDSQQLNVSLDFQRSDVESGTERMVWNHMKFGVALQGDALIIHAANTDQAFHKGFKIKNAGIDDTEKHSLNVAIDATTDRLQVVLDGEVVLDERDTDFDFVGAGGNEWGWSIGTAWNRYYEGSVSDFWLDDQVIFVDDASLLA